MRRHHGSVGARRGAPRGGRRAAGRSAAAGPGAGGGAVTEESTARSTKQEAGGAAGGPPSAEEGRRALHQLRPLVPAPMTRLHGLEPRLAPERGGVPWAELLADVRAASRPQKERRAPQLAESTARPLQRLRGRGAVELQDRALRTVVEAVPRAVGDGGRQRASERAPGGEAHQQLACEGRTPNARDAVPAEAWEQRHRYEHEEPLDSIGEALGQGEPDRTPVVHDEREAVEPGAAGERLEPTVVALNRVVELGRLGGVSESRQVGRHSADALE